MPPKKKDFYDPAAGGDAGSSGIQVDPSPQSSALAAITTQVEEDNASLTADAGLNPELMAAVAPQSERGDLNADIARIRAQRKPFGAFTQKLAYPARTGYHRHWFSDEPGRVDEAKLSGWAHVKDEKDQPVKRVVGRSRDGGPLMGYLMELPKVFWEEDMQSRHDAAQARVDEIKKAPFRSKPGQAHASDAGKFYSPQEGDVLTVSKPGR